MNPSSDDDESSGDAAALAVAAAVLARARRLVVLTGAGVSAESGIATFRDALTGFWAHHDASRLATAEAFRRDPGLVWGWYEWRRGRVLRATPNAGHRAIATLAERIADVTLVTQNVDDLHERAGGLVPIHLHGRLDRPRCIDCSRPFALRAELPAEPEEGRRLAPPRCGTCGGLVRPGVVWFGEGLPMAAWDAAVAAAKASDTMLVVGTSGVVYPAAGLVRVAADHGAAIVRIDPAVVRPEGWIEGWTETHVAGPAGTVLPRLLSMTWPV